MQKLRIYIPAALLLLTGAALLMGGCSGRSSEPPFRPVQHLNHVIRFNGETLSLIARWYTGRTDQWKTIAAVNPELNPQRLRIGQVVRIPSELLITDRLMTEAYVSRNQAESIQPPISQAEVSASSQVNPSLQPLGDTASEDEKLKEVLAPESDTPPERTLPAAGETAASKSAETGSGSADTGNREKSRDDLLKELLQEQ